MKKLIIAALLVVGMSSFAQDKKEMEKRPRRDEMEKFTPEQRNQLMLKKMTLDLDLNAKQQEQMKQIIAEQSTKREAMRTARKANQEKPTSDELFAMKNKMLDEQIVMKNKMKSILSPEQFEKWDAMKEKQHQRNGHRGHHGGERKAELKK
ncbi:hypothetical protein [Flavobacterium sp. AED]|uniref:hypothetical protein n=1 Tax=Flavobacterium sp. AED TaxID=1423323 RepID=UPI000691FD8C|nr:hypothetical protein [Flavobacterium sp. AED]